MPNLQLHARNKILSNSIHIIPDYNFYPKDCTLPVDLSHLTADLAWPLLVNSILKPLQSDIHKDSSTIVMSATQAIRYKSLFTLLLPKESTCPFSLPQSVEFNIKLHNTAPVAGAIAFTAAAQPDASSFMYICNIQVNGKTLVAMLDSGANRTMGALNSLKDKGFFIHYTASVPAMEAANEALIPVRGSVQGKFRIGKFTTGGNEEILLMDNLSTGIDIIIGMDLLHKHDISLHHGNHTDEIKGKRCLQESSLRIRLDTAIGK